MSPKLRQTKSTTVHYHELYYYWKSSMDVDVIIGSNDSNLILPASIFGLLERKPRSVAPAISRRLY